MDASKVLKAIMLQKQVNYEIETFGEASASAADELMVLVDSLTSSEEDLFLSMYLDLEQIDIKKKSMSHLIKH
jgi:hypothetical protein